jgi:hypothetical protein
VYKAEENKRGDEKQKRDEDGRKTEGRRKDGKLSGDHALSQSEASIKHPENLPGSYHPYERDNEQWKQYGRKTDGGLDENKRGDEKQKREEDGTKTEGWEYEWRPCPQSKWRKN